MTQQAIILITGIQAAGKSTIGQKLAERLERSVHVRGDSFRRMIVNGREDMTPNPSDEAWRQLRMRYRQTAMACDEYFREGFTVVAQDVIIGEPLGEMVRMIKQRPLLVVVLAPRPEAVLAREKGRSKADTYDQWTIELLDKGLREDTPKIGLWLDTSDQTPDETVDEILSRAWSAGSVD
ncbi:AAA family ATPase [Kibdelosporangium philippinense]|uniref:AAA family ATPase n=1 Tax=Kibdelosporangium philippinense TaxID=211113 RepID=A0ABS8ZH58_9PSEU|nr:AAA family ATPase [Kibdelosporangium philippinense]MCE7006887.1 AAA family ATPase [Kibdelosporangium philippinense]